MGRFITFEGIEGSGKSTQIALLAEFLQSRRHPHLVTREPGGCPIADAIRRILLDPANAALTARTELLLYAAARAQHVEEVIRPALSRGLTVLCDRYTDATLAYQGFGRGLDRALIADLNRVAAGETRPDLTLLLDMPAESGLDRAKSRNALHSPEEDRFERESLEFHLRIREGYLRLAENEPDRFAVIDASGEPAVVSARIQKVVLDLIAPGDLR